MVNKFLACVHATSSMNVNAIVFVYLIEVFIIYTPGVRTFSYAISSPLGRIQHLNTLLQLWPIITI